VTENFGGANKNGRKYYRKYRKSDKKVTKSRHWFDRLRRFQNDRMRRFQNAMRLISSVNLIYNLKNIIIYNT
jgi:hypothetical protein